MNKFQEGIGYMLLHPREKRSLQGIHLDNQFQVDNEILLDTGYTCLVHS